MRHLKSLTACVTVLTATAMALPGTSAHAAPVRYEAESSPAACTGTIDSDHTGYTGSGFCDGNNAAGAYVQFTVNAAAAGTATSVCDSPTGARLHGPPTSSSTAPLLSILYQRRSSGTTPSLIRVVDLRLG
jgi:hypothetical protein